MTSSVSAIIPVYNGEKCVARAIESALRQTTPLKEIIVIDDGSTDRTFDVINRYPVIAITQRNAGPAAARNSGAQRATSEWLAFLDHDDTWRPEKTERQLEFSSGEKVGVIYTPGRKQDEAPVTWENLWNYNIVGSPTGALVNRKCLFEVGGFDTRRILIGTEDYNLWLRIALTSWQFASCPGELFDYTPEENSLSTRHAKMAVAECQSLQDIGKQAGMSDAQINRRETAVKNHYIRELIGVRDLLAAREMIQQTGIGNVSLDLLLAAFSPEWVFRLRREIRSKLRKR